MLGTLLLNTTEITALWYTADKVPAVSIRPVTGIWEQSAAFDDRSPNFYYHVIFTCFYQGDTPWDTKHFLSQFRDNIGEGPIDANFERGSVNVDFENLRWVANPAPSNPDDRATIFTIEFYTETPPEEGA